MRKLGRFILWCFAGIGAVTLSIILAIVSFTATVRNDVPDLPDVAVLSLDWNVSLVERHDALPFFETTPATTVLETVTALDRAAETPQIKALVVEMGAIPLDFSLAQELAESVRRFRQSGKPAYVFAADLAAFGDGTPEVMLASAFDEVWMRSSGMVGLTGVALEVPYFADGLDELGVEAEFEQRHEFKGGADPFTKRFMPLPIRKSLTDLADGLLEEAVTIIAEGRGLEPARVRELVNQGPFLAQEAINVGLIDQLGYEQDFFDAVWNNVGDSAEWIEVDLLLASTEPTLEEGVEPTRVAVLYGLGAIGGETEQDPFSNSDFDAYGVLETLAEIEEDGGYDAVLLRIESPGGAYGTSDAVWDAVNRVRAAGTPVVVSMGSVAASGGYFIAMAADRIVAQPTTITGSIGVYGGNFDASGLWDRLGVNWQQITAGENAGMWTLNRGFDEAERERLAVAMDFVYADFTEKVAEARGFDAEALNAVARGRVWTGKAAKEVGLVDALGGYEVAQAQIRDLLNLEEDAVLELTILPEPKEAWEAALEALESGDFPLAMSQVLTAALEDRVVARAETFLGDLSVFETPRGILTAPPMRLQR